MFNYISMLAEEIKLQSPPKGLGAFLTGGFSDWLCACFKWVFWFVCTMLFKILGLAADLLNIAFYIFCGLDLNNGAYYIKVSSTGSRENILDYFLFSESITKAYLGLSLIGIVLIVIFTIYKIIKQDYFDKAGPRSKGPIFRNVAISCIAFLLVIPIFYLVIRASSALAVFVMDFMGMNASELAGAKVFKLCWSDSGATVTYVNNIADGTTDRKLNWLWNLNNSTMFFIHATKGNLTWLAYDGVKQSRMLSLFDANSTDDSHIRDVVTVDGVTYENVTFFWYVYLVGIIVVIKSLYDMILAMIQRIFKLLGLFLVAPSPISQYVLDDGQKYKTWLQQTIQEGLRVVVCTMSLSIFLLALNLITDIDFYSGVKSGIDVASSADASINVSPTLLSYNSTIGIADTAEEMGFFEKAFASLVNAAMRVILIMAAGGAIKDLDTVLSPLISGAKSSMESGATGAAANKAATAIGSAVAKGAGAVAGGVAGLAAKGAKAVVDRGKNKLDGRIEEKQQYEKNKVAAEKAADKAENVVDSAADKVTGAVQKGQNGGAGGADGPLATPQEEKEKDAAAEKAADKAENVVDSAADKVAGAVGKTASEGKEGEKPEGEKPGDSASPEAKKQAEMWKGNRSRLTALKAQRFGLKALGGLGKVALGAAKGAKDLLLDVTGTSGNPIIGAFKSSRKQASQGIKDFTDRQYAQINDDRKAEGKEEIKSWAERGKEEGRTSERQLAAEEVAAAKNGLQGDAQDAVAGVNAANAELDEATDQLKATNDEENRLAGVKKSQENARDDASQAIKAKLGVLGNGDKSDGPEMIKKREAIDAYFGHTKDGQYVQGSFDTKVLEDAGFDLNDPELQAAMGGQFGKDGSFTKQYNKTLSDMESLKNPNGAELADRHAKRTNSVNSLATRMGITDPKQAQALQTYFGANGSDGKFVKGTFDTKVLTDAGLDLNNSQLKSAMSGRIGKDGMDTKEMDALQAGADAGIVTLSGGRTFYSHDKARENVVHAQQRAQEAQSRIESVRTGLDNLDNTFKYDTVNPETGKTELASVKGSETIRHRGFVKRAVTGLSAVDDGWNSESRRANDHDSNLGWTRMNNAGNNAQTIGEGMMQNSAQVVGTVAGNDPATIGVAASAVAGAATKVVGMTASAASQKGANRNKNASIARKNVFSDLQTTNINEDQMEKSTAEIGKTPTPTKVVGGSKVDTVDKARELTARISKTNPSNPAVSEMTRYIGMYDDAAGHLADVNHQKKLLSFWKKTGYKTDSFATEKFYEEAVGKRTWQKMPEADRNHLRNKFEALSKKYGSDFGDGTDPDFVFTQESKALNNESKKYKRQMDTAKNAMDNSLKRWGYRSDIPNDYGRDTEGGTPKTTPNTGAKTSNSGTSGGSSTGGNGGQGTTINGGNITINGANVNMTNPNVDMGTGVNSPKQGVDSRFGQTDPLARTSMERQAEEEEHRRTKRIEQEVDEIDRRVKHIDEKDK